MNKYYTIYDWMFELAEGLNLTDINIIALIYSFQCDDKPYTGGAPYIIKRLGIAKSTAQRSLSKLVSKGLLEKKRKRDGNIYEVSKCYFGKYQNDTSRDVKMTPNNKKNKRRSVPTGHTLPSGDPSTPKDNSVHVPHKKRRYRGRNGEIIE